MNPVATRPDRREKMHLHNARQTAAFLMAHTKEDMEAERADSSFITDRLVRWMRGIKP
jgi:hypothetical protein